MGEVVSSSYVTNFNKMIVNYILVGTDNLVKNVSRVEKDTPEEGLIYKNSVFPDPDGGTYYYRDPNDPKFNNSGIGATRHPDGYFYKPSPFPSWTLNLSIYEWEAPVAHPNGYTTPYSTPEDDRVSGLKYYKWDESAKNWVEDYVLP